MGAPLARLRPILAAALLLAGCAHTSSLQPRGLKNATSTEDELRAALDGRRVALVVGVDEYDSSAFKPLGFAASDAGELGRVLADPGAGGFDRVVVLDERSSTTRSGILSALRDLAADLRPQDQFLLYFSGHGTLSADGDDANLFLLPSDAAPSDLAGTAIDLAVVRDYFGLLPAQRKVLVVDSCFHGEGKGVANPTVAVDLSTLSDSVELSSARGMGSGEAHLFASTFGLPAFEDRDLGHGVYTHYLLQALSWARRDADADADGLVTAWEVHDFARRRTRQHTEDRQLPEASIRVVGSNDFVFAGDAERRAQREGALVFHYGPRRQIWAGAALVIDGQSKGVFPATMAVEPGRRHVEVRASTGELLIDGYADFEAGEAVRISELPVRVREDRVLLALRGGFAGGPPSSWGALWGSGLAGVEAWTALRKARGPGRGLYMAGTLGVGASPERQGVDGLLREPRLGAWLGAEGGWGFDVRRFRLRAGWQVRATLLPVAKRADPAMQLRPEEAGWVIGSTGPTLQVGVLLSRRTSLILAGTLLGAPIDIAGSGLVRLEPLGALTAGVELGL